MTEVREKFEAWAERQGLFTDKHDDGEYLYASTRDSWRAWQAAWAASKTEHPAPRGNLPGLYLESGEFVPADKLQEGNP